MKQLLPTKEDVKKALMAILIGLLVSGLTELLQYALGILHSLEPAIPGALVAMGKYISTWKSNHLG